MKIQDARKELRRIAGGCACSIEQIFDKKGKPTYTLWIATPDYDDPCVEGRSWKEALDKLRAAMKKKGGLT